MVRSLGLSRPDSRLCKHVRPPVGRYLSTEEQTKRIAQIGISELTGIELRIGQAECGDQARALWEQRNTIINELAPIITDRVERRGRGETSVVQP